MLTLVHGARRSGKSAYAERLALGSQAPVTVLAPLTVTDDEMRVRVAAHRARRPAAWRTVERLDVAAALAEVDPHHTVLLDSLGTWVAERLWRDGALDGDAATPDLRGEAAALAEAATARAGLTVVVCEEAGWGPVPPDAGTRAWLDALGDAAQALSARADRAVLIVAGRALELPR